MFSPPLSAFLSPSHPCLSHSLSPLPPPLFSIPYLSLFSRFSLNPVFRSVSKRGSLFSCHLFAVVFTALHKLPTAPSRGVDRHRVQTSCKFRILHLCRRCFRHALSPVGLFLVISQMQLTSRITHVRHGRFLIGP